MNHVMDMFIRSEYMNIEPILEPLARYLDIVEGYKGKIILPSDLNPPTPPFTKNEEYKGFFNIGETELAVALIGDDTAESDFRNANLELQIVHGKRRARYTNNSFIVRSPPSTLATIVYCGAEQKYLI